MATTIAPTVRIICSFVSKAISVGAGISFIRSLITESTKEGPIAMYLQSVIEMNTVIPFHTAFTRGPYTSTATFAAARTITFLIITRSSICGWVLQRGGDARERRITHKWVTLCGLERLI